MLYAACLLRLLQRRIIFILCELGLLLLRHVRSRYRLSLASWHPLCACLAHRLLLPQGQRPGQASHRRFLDVHESFRYCGRQHCRPLHSEHDSAALLHQLNKQVEAMPVSLLVSLTASQRLPRLMDTKISTVVSLSLSLVSSLTAQPALVDSTLVRPFSLPTLRTPQ